MSESTHAEIHAIECLRLETDCRELARNVRSPDLRARLLHMAQIWSDLAVCGPDTPHGGDNPEIRKPAASTKSTQARSILIVEGHKLLRSLMAGLMKTTGFEVVQAANADEALSILEARTDIALLVTNVVMKGDMDGVELVHAVDIRWPSIKLIMVSGKRGLTESDLPPKCILLTKPYHDDELVFEARSLIDA